MNGTTVVINTTSHVKGIKDVIFCGYPKLG